MLRHDKQTLSLFVLFFFQVYETKLSQIVLIYTHTHTSFRITRTNIEDNTIHIYLREQCDRFGETNVYAQFLLDVRKKERSTIKR